MYNPTKIFKTVEFVLWFIILLAVCYIGFFIIYKSKESNAAFVSNVSKQQVNLSNGLGIYSLERKPYDYYQQKINKRDIFIDATVSPTNNMSASSQVVTGQLPMNFKVVGIVLGVQPQVIIEDTQSMQTYFIDKNEPQAGMLIDHVDQQTVYLNYNGQIIGIDLKGSLINLKQKSAI